MPLRDRDKTRPRRLMRLGIIRLGFKIFKCLKNGCNNRIRETGERSIKCPKCGQTNPKSKRRSYPTQADHFVLTDAPEIAAIYGLEPQELDVILPFPDIERNFDAAYTVWAGGVLVCRGDGEYVDYATPHKIVRKTVRNREVISVHNAPGDTLVSNGMAQVAFGWNGESFKPGDHVPCPGADSDLYPHCASCKVSAILKVMMARPDLFRLGYYQIATGSGRNYDTILGTLELIHSQAGKVNGIPFKLRLVEEATVYREDGKRKKTEKWFLQLEPDPEFTRKLYRQQVARILDEGKPVARLPESVETEETEFEEWDEPAPPPIAEIQEPIEVDVETGEIISEPSKNGEEQPSQTTSNGNGNGNERQAELSWPGDIVDAVKKGGWAEHPRQAVGRLNKLHKAGAIDPNDALDVILAAAKLYSEKREGGLDSDKAAQAVAAAINVNQKIADFEAMTKDDQQSLFE